MSFMVYMKINSLSNINFGSLNNPVGEFKINTAKGALTVKEVYTPELIENEKLNKEISDYIMNEFVDNSYHPGFTKHKQNKDSLAYKMDLYNNTLRNQNLFLHDKGDDTILTVRNRSGRLNGAIIASTYRNSAYFTDPKTCFVEELAVSKDYQKCGIGKILMDQVFNKSVFEDIVLFADNGAVKFYERCGFKKPDINIPVIDNVMTYLEKDRCDLDYIKFMFKHKDNSPCLMWDRFSKLIDEYFKIIKSLR